MEEFKYSICVSALKKKYKDKEVLSNVTFSVPKGSIYTLLGSNGAGKTTTIRILTTQIKADNGTVQIEGYNVFDNPQKVHEVISLTGQFSAVDECLTGKENLIIMGKLRHLSKPEETAENLLEYFELAKASNRIVSTYSGGMKRKLDIAMSLIGNPKVIFLDEPTTGLDPQSRHSMWNIIRDLNKSGVTIFLTTQYLEEAEQLADIIGILDNGKIIAEGTPEELKAYLPQGAVQFTFGNSEEFEKAKLLMKDYKVSIEPEKYSIIVFTDGKADTLSRIFNILYTNKISFNDYHDTENSKVSEAEIVGIYQVDQKMSPLMQGDTYRSENVIFTDLRFPEKAEGETSPLYEKAYFKVEDVEAYDEVKENLQKVDINWEQYDLIDNNGNSETMSSNFNDLAKVSEMMILVISVASFVILVLVFLFWLKNRVQEVGIFLSLGVPKFRIIGQIWSEAIMIAVLSLMLSFAVAPAVSKVTANYLVSQQVQQMQEEEKNNEGKVSTEYVAPKQDVQNISVEVTPEMYLLDGVSVLVLITASVLVSGIVILKRNPKDILSEMS